MSRAFGLYVQPELIEQILKDPAPLKLGGEEAELTVMFSDVQGFTTVSEKLQPTQLVNLLNEHLSAMSDAIMESGGTVDKYNGDSIMAFWGRPYPQDDHAVRACTACLGMLDQLRILNAKWKSEGRLELKIEVSLNTGPMVVGNIGSLKRFNYTVIGHAVNMGSRLQGQNREYGTQILVGESTYEQAKDHFVFREIDLIRIKGVAKPMSIYELMAPAEDAEKWRPLTDSFARGLKAYREGEFRKALEVFKGLLSTYPDDGPSKLFVHRSKAFIEEGSEL